MKGLFPGAAPADDIGGESPSELGMTVAERDYDAEMRLPEGKTCGDCISCQRCVAIFGHQPSDQVCDWAPSRFRPKRSVAAPPPLGGSEGGSAIG